MKLTGLIRCRNGARWLPSVIESLLKVCNNIVVLDDHSTDSSYVILRSFRRVTVLPSLFTETNEARDKTYLVGWAKQLHNPDWILFVDADEVLLDHGALLENLNSGRASAYSLNVKFLWDRPDQIRVDGVYGDFWRGSVFKVSETNGIWEQRSGDGPNLHCSSVPTDLLGKVLRSSPAVRLKHFGPMKREDRIAKYYWYLQTDTTCLESEDHYRHSVIGDLPEFPVESVFRHGGPLKLERWKENDDDND